MNGPAPAAPRPGESGHDGAGAPDRGARDTDGAGAPDVVVSDADGVAPGDGVGPGVDREARHPSPTTSARPTSRPAPQYGEYAPEGWINPVIVEHDRREREEAAQRRRLAAEEAARVLADRAATRSRRGGPVRPEHDSGWAHAPRRAGDDHRPGDLGPRAPGAGAGGARVGASPGDVLATVLLLVFGVTTVLQQITGISRLAGQIAEQIALRYTALAHPGSLVPATALNAVVGLVLLAGAIWWSVSRLRRRRVTFWVPLVAGAVFGAFSTVVYVVVIMQDPAFAAYVFSHGGAV